MKTIIVPTDFSPAANNAARYAMHIAQKVHANIKLCNAIVVPSESVMAAQVAWPLEDMESLKSEADAELGHLSQSLEALNENGFSGPHVKHSLGFGNVTDLVRNTFHDDRANLVVMGLSGANAIARFVLGSNSKELINKADFPVLLIPKDYIFAPLKKIVFATDLSEKDIDSLHSLANFARYFNAEILISHIKLPRDHDKCSDGFLSDVTCKIDYPNIYFRQIPGTNVDDELNAIARDAHADMVVMMHRQHGLFSSSHTQKLAVNTTIPLLVLPDGFHKVLL